MKEKPRHVAYVWAKMKHDLKEQGALRICTSNYIEVDTPDDEYTMTIALIRRDDTWFRYNVFHNFDPHQKDYKPKKQTIERANACESNFMYDVACSFALIDFKPYYENKDAEMLFWNDLAGKDTWD